MKELFYDSLKHFIFFVGWAFLLPAGQVMAQQMECGSVPGAEQLNRIKELKILSAGIQKRATDTIYIPIKIHVIRRTNGTGGMLLSQISNELDIVNDVYAETRVQFYLCDTVNTINDDDLYIFEKNVDEAFTADVFDQENVLNIYFAGRLYRTRNQAQDTTYLCGYAYFPPGPDRIFMSNTCATNGSTLAHEIGHYLGLLHTHDSGNGDELADGSNCAFAGDLFCDTPADPNLSGEVNSSCIYTGTDVDLNGDTYTPDPTNIMSYSRKSCRFTFSQEQMLMMNVTAFYERDYLIAPLMADFSYTASGLDVSLQNLTSGAQVSTWDFGDGNTSNAISQVYAFADTGNYLICLSARNTCLAKDVCEYVQVSCNTLEADFAYDDAGETDYVVDFTSPFSDSTQVNWSFGNGQTGSGSNTTHTYIAPGDYEVTLIVTNNCGADTLSRLITVDSLVDLSSVAEINLRQLRLYPNPVTDQLYLDVRLQNHTLVHLISLVGEKRVLRLAGGNTLDVADLPNGVWLVYAQEGDRVYRGKFVKISR